MKQIHLDIAQIIVILSTASLSLHSIYRLYTLISSIDSIRNSNSLEGVYYLLSSLLW